MTQTPFTEFRKDGWPLCPNCGDDELYCPGSVWFYKDNGRPPTLQECIEMGLKCYRCQSEYLKENK